jgi:transposase
MAELVSDELWERIKSLLPPEPAPSPKGGRPRVPHRSALAGVVFVLKTGIPWQALPSEMNCGSGSTCWRRFAEWTQLAVWTKVHTLLLLTLGKAGAINLERAVIDSASVRAVLGGLTRARIPRIAPKRAANGMS